MFFRSRSKLVPALILTNLWTFALSFLAWNYRARYEATQRNEDKWLGLLPEWMQWSEIREDLWLPVHNEPEPNDGGKEEGVGVVTATRPVRPAQDPNLPTFCPECGQGDLLCAKYGWVLLSVQYIGRGLPRSNAPCFLASIPLPAQLHMGERRLAFSEYSTTHEKASPPRLES